MGSNYEGKQAVVIPVKKLAEAVCDKERHKVLAGVLLDEKRSVLEQTEQDPQSLIYVDCTDYGYSIAAASLSLFLEKHCTKLSEEITPKNFIGLLVEMTESGDSDECLAIWHIIMSCFTDAPLPHSIMDWHAVSRSSYFGEVAEGQAAICFAVDDCFELEPTIAGSKLGKILGDKLSLSGWCAYN